MQCKWGTAGPGPTDLTLTLFNGVNLVEPELWQLVEGENGPEFVRVEHTQLDDSSVAWRVTPDSSGQCHLLLNWQALDPMHPTLPYDGEIAIRDVNGAVLPPASENPSTVSCQLGDPTPYWSSEQVAISIS